jgi:glycosyltransferase involved in cell wall biosynthesis
LVHQIARFHDVHVLTHAYNKRGIPPAELASSVVEFHFLRLPRPFWWLYKIDFGQRIYYYLWQIRAWRESRKLHPRYGFDLAHQVTFGNDWIPSYIGAFLPVPFVMGPIGGGQRTPRGLLREYTLGGRLCEWGREAAQWIGRRDPVRRRCFRKAKAILVCNTETKNTLPRANRHKVVFFPVNGVSSEDFSGLPSPEVQPRPFRVFMAGRFHRLKGFALAIRGFERFIRRNPEAEFVIVGAGTEGGRLRRLIIELGIEGKVRLVEWMPREVLLQEMRASDVMLFPSFRDGGGAVVVEAMASAKPVIGLDSGGPGFHIQPEWGFKISPKDPSYVAAEIAKALEKLFRDPALARTMGLAARRRAEAFYLWDRHGDRIQEIYLAAQHGARHD